LVVAVLRPQLVLPQSLAQIGCLGFAASGILEWSGGAPSIVALSHFATGIMILQVFSMHDVRNASLALLLSCMLVLTAGAMNVNFFYPLAFFPFVVLFCLSLQSLARAQQQADASSSFGRVVVASQASLLQWALFFVLWLGFFYLVPRGDAIAIGPSVVNQRIKGFSQTLRLGEVGSVLENTMVVMRIRPIADFPITGPTLRHLRGLLLRGRSYSRYTGGAWTREGYRTYSYPAYTQRGFVSVDKKLEYGRIKLVLDVLQENTDPPVLFVPVSASAITTRRPFLNADSDGSLTFDRRNAGIESYQAHIEVGTPDLSEIPYPDWKTVPVDLAPFFDIEDISPLVEDVARDVASGARTIPERIERTIKYLQETCQYSLEEPESQIRDPIAKFLFITRAGTCEHFASAMTLLLRSMGIPARPVSGYMMNEWNEYGGFFTVRQSDAHAWVEVYWPELGWIPFDPTPPQTDTLLYSRIDRIIGFRELWNQFEAHWFNLVYRFDRRAQEAGFRKIWASLHANAGGTLILLVLAILVSVLRRWYVRRTLRKPDSDNHRWIPEWFRVWEQTRPNPRRANETPREYLYRLRADVSCTGCQVEDIDMVVSEIRGTLLDGSLSSPCSEPCRQALHRLGQAMKRKAEESL
ncbi:MAG TPA: transglutaminaseTgpA domain-containing protein, partial [Candidatus Ozemobacteraceae bacterium]|nr:transglutaminaseTgpA domain-containing protein [Candidatus Ozemobacteraceae bacterium]